MTTNCSTHKSWERQRKFRSKLFDFTQHRDCNCVLLQTVLNIYPHLYESLHENHLIFSMISYQAQLQDTVNYCHRIGLVSITKRKAIQTSVWVSKHAAIAARMANDVSVGTLIRNANTLKVQYGHYCGLAILFLSPALVGSSLYDFLNLGFSVTTLNERIIKLDAEIEEHLSGSIDMLRFYIDAIACKDYSGGKT